MQSKVLNIFIQSLFLLIRLYFVSFYKIHFYKSFDRVIRRISHTQMGGKKAEPKKNKRETKVIEKEKAKKTKDTKSASKGN